MAHKKDSKQLPHERRKGEAALSDFAEYVEKQQALRYPSKAGAASNAKLDATYSAEAGAGSDDQHDELNDILDSLNLSDSAPRARLKDLLLSTDDGSLGQAS